MEFKNFNTGIILRLASILLCGLATGYVLFAYNYYYTASVFLVLDIILTLELLRYIRATHRKISRFFESAFYSDFNFSFSTDEKNKDLKRLHAALNNLLKKFRTRQHEAEDRVRFLEIILEQLPIGVMIFEGMDNLIIFNTQVRHILGDEETTNVQRLLEKYNDLVALPENSFAFTPTVYELKKTSGNVKIAVTIYKIIHSDKLYRVFALQNFSEQLEKKEIESWQNLIRVLTHEIMNSLTPVVSLADTSLQLARNKEAGDTLIQSLEIARKRSQGLLAFVNSYRKITNIKPLAKTTFRVYDLFAGIAILKSEEIKNAGIELSINVLPEDLELSADYDLLEQVVLNLVNNAIDALKENPKPTLKMEAAYDYVNKVQINVSDNGAGVDKLMLDKIFVPFFTTKKQGSGIGLSLSKQIVLMHGGSIYFDSYNKGNTKIVIKI